MNRTEYKNQHRKEHYDTILFAFPKGEKERIRRAASGLGMSVNEYLFALVCDDLHPERADSERKDRDSVRSSGVCWKSGKFRKNIVI